MMIMYVIHFSKNIITIFDKVKMKALDQTDLREGLYLLKHMPPRRLHFVGTSTFSNLWQ